jgi:hypothetical protein
LGQSVSACGLLCGIQLEALAELGAVDNFRDQIASFAFMEPVRD